MLHDAAFLVFAKGVSHFFSLSVLRVFRCGMGIRISHLTESSEISYFSRNEDSRF